MISRQLDDSVVERLKSEARERKKAMRLIVVPLYLGEANLFVKQWHRHHKPVVGARFSLGARTQVARDLVGVAIVGRPVSRGVDHHYVAEVTRLATDGSRNACSLLYAACARACREMGFTKIQTYILEDEPGTSLIAAGWEFEDWTAGGDWNHSTLYAGKRRTDQPMGRKQRWSKLLQPTASPAAPTVARWDGR